jgi:glucose/arabinose dehydrogenase
VIARWVVAGAAVATLTACGGGSARSAPSPSPARGAVASPTPSPTPAPLALQDLGDFSSPVWAGPAPGDPAHLYLAEKTGRVLQLTADGGDPHVVLDLGGRISTAGEQGLLSLAFDPAFSRNKRLYVDYTDKAGDTQVVAYTLTGAATGAAAGGTAAATPGVTAGAPQVLLTVDQPYVNHNGGALLFDRTRMLLVGLGDGGSAGDPQNRAQDLASDLGKILRIDPRTGAGAAGNPYPQNPRVWALGLRNPWRFSFDTNGDLYLGDVGQNREEELDVVRPADQRGANYGWPVYEGDDFFKRDRLLTSGGVVIAPALTYLHVDGGCSITGGEVYRGRRLPELVGTYVFGDFCTGRLVGVRRTPVGVTPMVELGPKVGGLQGFGKDLTGELLVMSTDTLYRLVPAKP